MTRRIAKWLIISTALCLLGCAKPQAPKEILVPTPVKLSPCPKPYSDDLGLQAWEPKVSLGHVRNVKITSWNLEALLLQIRLRDGVVKCYEDKIK